MNSFYLFLVPFGFLLLACGVCKVLEFFHLAEDPPLPSSRFLVTQGRNVYQCDTELEAWELAQQYSGVTRVERRHR